MAVFLLLQMSAPVDSRLTEMHKIQVKWAHFMGDNFNESR